MRLTLFIMSLCTLITAQEVIIHAGHLVDTERGRVQDYVSIVVENGTIKAIQDGFISGDSVIDLKSKWVLPGLMDMHTHMSSEFNQNSYSEGFRLNPTDFAYKSIKYAKRTLMAGFTTVREVGGSLSISMKQAIQRGDIIGPRIYTAGRSLATTGGHADPTNGRNAELMGDPGPKDGVINGVADARKAVRQRYKEGADLIKITATGGVLSVANSGQNPQFMMDELRAIVKTAADYGFHVAAHAHGTEGMKRAVMAGVKTIEHGTYMSDEVMELMKKNGTYLVPTLLAGKWVTDKAKLDGFFPPVVRQKAATIGPVIQSTFKRAVKKGVNIAFGTDCGVSPHGQNAQEFALMVAGGMSPMEAIQAATRETAKLLKIWSRAGSVATGKWADIIAVDTNPLNEIRTLENVTFVMKSGIIYKQ